MIKLTQKQKEAINARFSDNALNMMKKRYLLAHDDGSQETPADMFARVAGAMADVEKNYGKKGKEIEKIAQDFFDVMTRKEFTPAGRTLTNAGGTTPLIANCVVLPIHDSMESIFQTLKDSALLQQAGCGLGFDFSELRPANSPTKKSRGVASGPVSFLRAYDAAFATIKQQCFAKGTLIVTKRGLLPIENVCAGDETYTEKGWKKVTEVFFNGVRDTVKLTLDSGFEIELTPNHKVAVVQEGKIALKEVQDLDEKDVLLMKLGDHMGINGTQQTLKQIDPQNSKARKIYQPQLLDKKFAYFLGLYYADGNNDSQGIRVAVHDTDAEEKQFRVLLDQLFHIKDPFLEKRYDGCRKFHVSSQTLKLFLQENHLLKQYAWKIEVPEKILRSPRNVQMAFIAGFFDGDGDNGRNYRLNTTSKIFAQQLQLMLLNNGIGTKVKEERRRPYWRIVYRLGIIGKNSTHRFYEKLSSHSWKIQKKEETKDFGWIFPFHPMRDLGYSWNDIRGLHDGMRSTVSHSILSRIQRNAVLQQAEAVVQEKIDWTGFLPVRVKSIENAGRQEVYDFEVEDVHMINAGLYTKNSRHGANMSMMRVDHPDVLDFIGCKKVEGDIRNFNISVTVTDEFMEAVEKTPNKQWYCTFKGVKTKPHKVLRHPNGAVHGTEDVDITVKELFDKLVEAAWINGEPGIAFVDTWNKTNPLPGLGPLASTNPCITGDSMVVTEHGLIKMEELAETYGNTAVRLATDVRIPRTVAIAAPQQVFAGRMGQTHGEFSPLLFSAPNTGGIGEMVRAWKTGVKPVYRITTRAGYQLEATADHKIFTPEGKKPLVDLKTGDKILIQSKEGLWNKENRLSFEFSNAIQGHNGRIYHYNFPHTWSRELGQMLGWLVGDGWVRDQEGHRVVGFTFSQEDREVMEHLKKVINRFYGKEMREVPRENGVFHLVYSARPFVEYVKQLGVKCVRAQEKEVPYALWTAPREAVAGFLQGLFSADGTINVHEKNQTRYIRLTSKSEQLLRQTQILLLNFGVRSSLYNRSRKPRMAFGYANDGILFELQIAKTSIPVFLEKIGFLGTHYAQKTQALKTKEFYRETFEEEIKDIAFAGDKTVYDLTESSTHSFIANGFVISNCGEQVLHPYDNCNLSSINLAMFVKNKAVDFKRLRFVVRTATRLTDNVIDRFDYPVSQVTEMAKNNRRIGLGIMGFADMLYQLGIRYDSKQGFAMAEKVMGFINSEARKMSQELAKEKGTFPNIGLSVYGKKKIKMRNAALTTVAPTGSISMMMDASSGIEPNFALAYVKQDKDGHQYHYFNRYFEEALAKLKLAKKEKDEILQEIVKTGSVQRVAKLPKELRDTFVISMDISGEDHMRMQAAFQRNVDNSISKTVNFPNSATREEVARVFVSAWKLGCKSCTVYRDGSRTIQVLNVGTGENIVAPTEIPSAVQKKEAELPIDKQRIAPRIRPAVMSGKTYKMKTGYGNLYVTVNNDEKGIPFEMFATIGKSGGFYQEQSEAITKMVSLALRSGIKVEEVIGNLKGIRGPMPVFTETGTILSLPDALGKVLEEHVGATAMVEELISRPEHQEVLPFVKEDKAIADFGFMPGCPDCGSPLQMQEGCVACKSCGFSRCS